MPVDVATFLLNEKRTDIAKIEMRHRVNLVLIPNVHLETPQHNIVRLRHDQLNIEDVTLPSYKMVENPSEEPYTPPSAQTENKPVRQEAAVKGITSGQPAPIVEPKTASQSTASASVQPEGGLVTRILSWLAGSKKAIEPEPEEKKSERPRRETRGDGRGDSRRGGRNRQGREPRTERGEARPPRSEAAPQTDKADKTEAPQKRGRGEKREDRPAAEPRATREPREPREPRQPRPPRPQSAEQAANGVTNEVTAQQESGETATQPIREGQQRSRRGRRGGSRSERSEGRTEEVATEQNVATTEMPEAAEIPVAAPFSEAPQIAAITAMTPEESPAPVLASAPIPQPAAPLPEEIVAVQPVEPALQAITTAPEPEALAAPVVVSAPPPPAPKIDLSASLEQAGLIMIETSGDTAPPAAEISMPAQSLGRKPRPVAIIPSEPLQMVETRNNE